MYPQRGLFQVSVLMLSLQSLGCPCLCQVPFAGTPGPLCCWVWKPPCDRAVLWLTFWPWGCSGSGPFWSLTLLVSSSPSPIRQAAARSVLREHLGQHGACVSTRADPYSRSEALPGWFHWWLHKEGTLLWTWVI